MHRKQVFHVRITHIRQEYDAIEIQAVNKLKQSDEHRLNNIVFKSE